MDIKLLSTTVCNQIILGMLAYLFSRNVDFGIILSEIIIKTCIGLHILYV